MVKNSEKIHGLFFHGVKPESQNPKVQVNLKNFVFFETPL